MAAAGIRGHRCVDEHAARLYRLAYLYLHDRPVAEDAAQEAFLEFWREASRVENPGAWLSRVVRNRCLNELRRRGREQLTDPQDLATEDRHGRGRPPRACRCCGPGHRRL